MNNAEITKRMIAFVEDIEKDFQTTKMVSETKNKTDVVNSILNRLEKEIEDEN